MANGVQLSFPKVELDLLRQRKHNITEVIPCLLPLEPTPPSPSPPPPPPPLLPRTPSSDIRLERGAPGGCSFAIAEDASVVHLCACLTFPWRGWLQLNDTCHLSSVYARPCAIRAGVLRG